MEYFPAPLEKLVEQFARLPGIGSKSAQRLAFHVLNLPMEQAQEFANAIVEAKQKVTLCPICRNLTAGGPCPICANPKRDESLLCVVADPRDVIAMERAREFHGRYHVLHGVLSPMNHVGPDDLQIKPLVEEEIKHERHSSMYPAASFQLIIAMGIGTVLSKLLSLTGMTFPIYIGAMIAAACIRNLGEYGGKFTVYMGEINDIGGICLSLFLGMAMITLKIWQLAELALPLVVLLAGQTLFMILYVVLVVFNIMGSDYDAAVIVSGTCGFGMGATPNAMANMQAVCDKYSPSVKAYLLIPLVGSLFADFINSLVITVFINFI